MIASALFSNPRILILTIGVIVAAGLSSLAVMPRLEDPVLSNRVGVVSIAYPGADAGQVESLIAVPVEERLADIEEIKQVRSSCQMGIANVVIDLKGEVSDVRSVWSKIRDRLSDLPAVLPELAQAPQLEVFPLKAYAAIIAVKPAGAAADLALVRRLALQLKASVFEVRGTEKVALFGDPGERLTVDFRPATLVAMKSSTGAIAAQIKQQLSVHPAGRLQQLNQQTYVEFEKASLPVDRVSNVLVSPGAPGESRRLSQVARVRLATVQPPASLAIVDGQRSIVLGVLAADNQQVDVWSAGVEAKMAQFNRDFIGEAEAEFLFLQRQHVQRRMQSLVQNLLVGTAAVVFVVLLLMGWRSMIVVGMALPLSALMVLAGMRAMGIPIHQISITGLIVALGLLIDNAIVVVDEVQAKVSRGESPKSAIEQTVGHLCIPLFGSTLTTVLAFLPIAMLAGPAGEFVGSIAISVMLAVTASFVLAMTVIPALNALLVFGAGEGGQLGYGFRFAAFRSAYEWTLGFVFQFPLLGVLVGVGLPAAGFYFANQLPRQFFPSSDRRQIQIEVERPLGASIAAVEDSVKKIRDVVSQDGRVDRQHWFLGASAPTFYYNVVPRRRGTPHYAQAIVDIDRDADAGGVVRDLQSAIDGAVLDSRVVVRELQQGPPLDAPVEVRVVGPDLAALRSIGDELRLVMSKTPGVLHTRADLAEAVPKIKLDFDPAAVDQAGLNKLEIARQVYAFLEGAPAGTVFDGAEAIPVVVGVNVQGADAIDSLQALPLVNPNPSRDRLRGDKAAAQRPPLFATDDRPTVGSLAQIRLDADLGAIVRINGQRVSEVKAYIEAGLLPAVVQNDFKKRLLDSGFTMSSKYQLVFGGESEQRASAVSSLVANAVVLVALMALTLVASFRSFRCALIVVAVGGLSIGLGPFALFVAGMPFGFMAIVGTMGLLGVAINDSIVVLAAIRADPQARGGDVDATVQVVSGCTRHIIATTLTTIVGFTPLILSGGGFWPPLAFTIAGGVGGATLLALYFVPSVYRLLYRSSVSAKA